MPELAEVEYYRRRWDPGIGRKVLDVDLYPKARDFRGTDVRRLVDNLAGATLRSSEARGKQMVFRFSGNRWLGIHLGMTGNLRVVRQKRTTGRGAEETPPVLDGFHDHLVLYQRGQALVFSDPRQFGRVLFFDGPGIPDWWSKLPPSLLSPEFTSAVVEEFLRRHARAPIKAVLLRQDRFPGIGNWMADEILWRAGVHPALPAGRAAALAPRIRREIRFVARVAMSTIGESWADLPRGWLFHRRWSDGEVCPRTRVPLVRETIGGRTTCWSPGRQKPIR